MFGADPAGFPAAGPVHAYVAPDVPLELLNVAEAAEHEIEEDTLALTLGLLVFTLTDTTEEVLHPLEGLVTVNV